MEKPQDNPFTVFSEIIKTMAEQSRPDHALPPVAEIILNMIATSGQGSTLTQSTSVVQNSNTQPEKNSVTPAMIARLEELGKKLGTVDPIPKTTTPVQTTVTPSVPAKEVIVSPDQVRTIETVFQLVGVPELASRLIEVLEKRKKPFKGFAEGQATQVIAFLYPELTPMTVGKLAAVLKALL